MSIAVVSGAAGFVGRRLCSALAADSSVRALLRNAQTLDLPSAVTKIASGDLIECPEGMLAKVCEGADTVYHLAGRAHRPDGGRSQHERDAYRRDNVVAMARLRNAAASVGVSRFVHLSSIKVLGDVSAEPLRPDAEPAPADVYARSKHEAEQLLLSHADNAMHVVIVRPPLVYGPGVKGNMAALLRLVDSGLPLPLDRAVGLRSLVAVDNLVDLLVRLGGSAVAADVLHVRDAEDLTVRDLVLALGRALERRVRLVAVPEPVVGCAAKAIGRSAWYERLFLPCRVDDSATREALGWQPPVATEQAIAEMGAWWRTR